MDTEEGYSLALIPLQADLPSFDTAQKVSH